MDITAISSSCYGKKRIEWALYVLYDLGGVMDDIPPEIGRYIQCVEMYHCLPSQLDDEDSLEIEKQWIIRNKRAEIDKAKADKKSGSVTIDANKQSFDKLNTEKI